ncbi:hypothetical protein RCG23_13120 [Neobacillus sp. PS3-34]|uniref:hypothetical protein n=1 Tax=Neobacillus sp. PS3-34 TaxID=3070678 RepID=UPI0027E00051|nr:hypothetical protein [Neobacillus sp. PS3-34]WML46598.1 hypothetical protein RCG23_13120 [Neobacillus sp. PS3-34]
MDNNKDIARSLEALLENLIRMVAKSNQHVDSLHKRVDQIEWMMREIKSKECCTPAPHEPSTRHSPQSRFSITI